MGTNLEDAPYHRRSTDGHPMIKEMATSHPFRGACATPRARFHPTGRSIVAALALLPLLASCQFPHTAEEVSSAAFTERNWERAQSGAYSLYPASLDSEDDTYLVAAGWSAGRRAAETNSRRELDKLIERHRAAIDKYRSAHKQKIQVDLGSHAAEYISSLYADSDAYRATVGRLVESIDKMEASFQESLQQWRSLEAKTRELMEIDTLTKEDELRRVQVVQFASRTIRLSITNLSPSKTPLLPYA